MTRMKELLKRYILIFGIPATILLIAACANMASPTGGAYDLDPPKVVKSSPGFNMTNYTKNRIELEFDENVVVDKPSEKVIVTPPQQRNPIIRSVNRKVRVELQDTLLANTTYTIDFTDAIRDNNEGNVLENFSYSFSTGDKIDSLAISGRVVNAEDLEPLKGIFVGLHSNLNDTAFTKTKFERISKTNEKGEFTIRGVGEGRYRVFALDDNTRKYMYQNMGSAVAFWDSIVEPYSVPAIRQDSVFKKDKKTGFNIYDTIVDVNYTRFMPDDLVLRAFVSNVKRKYLQNVDRKENRLHVHFGAPTELPILEPLSFSADKDWYVLERYATNDTLTYWIKDKDILAIDTLSFRMSYLQTDSLNQDHWISEVVKFAERGRKKEKEDKKKKKKDDEEPEIVFLNMKSDIAGSWDVYSDINFEFDEPLITDFAEKIKLEKLIDTTFTRVDDFIITIDSLNPRKYSLRYRWNYGEEYQLSLDSASLIGYSGLWNDKYSQQFKVKSKDQYGEIAISLPGIGDLPAYVELVDKSDKPYRKIRVKREMVLFKNVIPGEYFARLIVDTNNNYKWDTGNYFENKQPELVFYCEKKFTLRANWQNDENWPIDVSVKNATKPLEVTKNKPETKKNKQQELEERDRKKDDEEKRMREEGKNLGTGNSSRYGDRDYDYNNNNSGFGGSNYRY